MPYAHGPLIFTYGRKSEMMGFVAKNLSAVTLYPGENVMATIQTGGCTWICVNKTATATTFIRQRVMGIVYPSTILPNTTGRIGAFVFTNTVMVTGTVANGDILKPSVTWAGVAVRATNLSPTYKTGFAYATGNKSAGPRGAVEALVVPWRV